MAQKQSLLRIGTYLGSLSSQNKLDYTTQRYLLRLLFKVDITHKALASFKAYPDDDRIVSHDAIFYVHDATSKLSVISS